MGVVVALACGPQFANLWAKVNPSPPLGRHFLWGCYKAQLAPRKISHLEVLDSPKYL